MKKIISCLLLSAVFAASAFAAPTTYTKNAVSAEGAQFFGGVDDAAAKIASTPLIKFSTGVAGLVNYNGTIEYMIMTKHTNGSKIFGTANDTTSIFWTQEAKGILTNTKSIGTNAENFTAANKWTAN